jgi:hypothetical protein
MFVRAKKVKRRVYYQLVQGYRDEAGRVQHRTITSLGTCPTLAWMPMEGKPANNTSLSDRESEASFDP